MDRPQHPDRTERKKWPKWVYDSEAKNVHLTKIAISVIAVVLSIIVLIICVYLIIPSIISDASDSIDKKFALQIYESTLTNTAPLDGASSVFDQPRQDFPIPPKPRECFAAALAQNPEIIGRIAIEDIGITYLVTQSGDNERYLKTGYNGNASHLGTVFLDYRCDADSEPLKRHYILYGHSFDNGGLFYNLRKYNDKNTFYNDCIIAFDTLYRDYTWEVFSAYTTNINFNFIKTEFKNDEEWLEFLNEIQEKSMYKTDTVLSQGDVVLTLCTCVSGSDDERFVVHARLKK